MSEERHRSTCPRCGSQRIDVITRLPELSGGRERRIFKCTECGKTFQRVFDTRFERPLSDD